MADISEAAFDELISAHADALLDAYNLRAKLTEAEGQISVLKSAHGANTHIRRRIRRFEHFDTEKASVKVMQKLEAARDNLAARDARIAELEGALKAALPYLSEARFNQGTGHGASLAFEAASAALKASEPK